MYGRGDKHWLWPDFEQTTVALHSGDSVWLHRKEKVGVKDLEYGDEDGQNDLTEQRWRQLGLITTMVKWRNKRKMRLPRANIS